MAFKKKLVKAVDLYDNIISSMTSNGWENISSMVSPAAGSVVVADGTNSNWDVLRSTTNGAIYQMRPFPSANQETFDEVINITQDVRNTTIKTFSIRMLTDYTPNITEIPGANQGSPSTFKYGKGTITQNPLVPWLNARMFNTEDTSATTAIPVTIENVELMYDVTGDRAIFIFTYPSVLNVKSSFIYFGIPNSVRGTKSGKQDAIYASSFQPATGHLVYSINYPVGVGNSVDNTYLQNNTQVQLPLKNPSYLNEYWLTPIYWGKDQFGIRGKLDGIYAMAANIGLINKDNIVIGNKKYEVVELGINSSYCSFNAEWIVVELFDA